MNLIKCFQTQGIWYNEAPRKGRPVGILWHDTNGGNPYIKRYVQPSDDAADKDQMLELLGKNKYGNDWNHSDRTAGVNAFIGKLADGSIATVQTGEWDIHPYGCGSGDYGSCNGYVFENGKRKWVEPFWIQFEICDDGYVSKSYYDKIYKEAVEFTAYICKKFNIDPFGTVDFNGQKIPTILCHGDANKLGVGNGHEDIYKWHKALKLPQNMDKIKKDVAALIGVDVPEEPEVPVFHDQDIVRLKEGAVFASGAQIKSWVFDSTIYCRGYKGDNVIISVLREGDITGTVEPKWLELVSCPHKTEEKPEEIIPEVEPAPVEPTPEPAPIEPEIEPEVEIEPEPEPEPEIEPPVIIDDEDDDFDNYIRDDNALMETIMYWLKKILSQLISFFRSKAE